MNTPASTDAPNTATVVNESTVRKAHPFRGAFWGLLMGIGAAVLAIILKITTLSLTTTIVIVALGIVLGIFWGLFGPERKPKGPPPRQTVTVAPQSSRFDDFDGAHAQSGDDAGASGEADTATDSDGSADASGDD